MQFRSVLAFSSIFIVGAQFDQPIAISGNRNSTAGLVKFTTKDAQQRNISNDTNTQQIEEPVPNKTKEETHNDDIGKYIIPELERQQIEEAAKIKEESQPRQTQEEKDNAALLGGLHKRKLAKNAKSKLSAANLRKAVIIHPDTDNSETTPWNETSKGNGIPDTEQDDGAKPKGVRASKQKLLSRFFAWPTLILRGPEYLAILCDQLAGAVGLSNRGVWLMGFDNNRRAYYWNTKNPWKVTWNKPEALKLTKDPIGMTMSYLQATNLILLADTFLGNN